MRAEEIRQHLRTQPFEPIRIYMSDGSSFDVPHPDFVMLTRTLVTIGLGSTDQEIPERSVFCDPVHITRIERFAPAKRSNRRKRKQ